MKYLIVLQAQSSTQAYSKHLRIYEKIGVSERSKPENCPMFEFGSLIGKGESQQEMLACLRGHSIIIITNLISGESAGTVPVKR